MNKSYKMEGGRKFEGDPIGSLLEEGTSKNFYRHNMNWQICVSDLVMNSSMADQPFSRCSGNEA